MCKIVSADKSRSAKEDQSRNQTSSKITDFQGGSACQYTCKERPKIIATKKRNTSKTTRKTGNNVVIMSTNVSNIHKLSCIKLLTNSDLETNR